MNPRANVIRRLAGDFVQRMRVALGSFGGDAAVIVDQLDRNLAESIASSVCSDLGVDYEPPPEHPIADDGKPGGKARANSPWQKQHGLRYGKQGKV